VAHAMSPAMGINVAHVLRHWALPEPEREALIS
jgi:hypothetical protein